MGKIKLRTKATATRDAKWLTGIRSDAFLFLNGQLKAYPELAVLLWNTRNRET
jgi:hypothetical protein